MREQRTVVMATAAVGRRRRVERWFYIQVALLMILLNVLAFAPGIIDPSRRNVPLPLTPLVATHAVLSVLWLLLFLAQATLVATGRVAVHHRLGIAGAGLAAVFVATGFFTVIGQARRGFDLSGDISRLAPPGAPPDAPATLSILFFFLTFAVLVGAGMWYRHHPAVHRRLMLFAMLGGLTPTPLAHLIGHWPLLQQWAGVIIPATALGLLSLSAIYDRVSGDRFHPLSLWIPALLIVWQTAVNLVVVPSGTWREFSAWLIR